MKVKRFEQGHPIAIGEMDVGNHQLDALVFENFRCLADAGCAENGAMESAARHVFDHFEQRRLVIHEENPCGLDFGWR
jgi:hypothetical protein